MLNQTPRTARFRNGTANLRKSLEQSLSNRVAKAILDLKVDGETDSDFAKRIGQSPQTISNYRQNVNGASLEVLRDVCLRTGVEPAALLGIGKERDSLDVRTLDVVEQKLRRLFDELRATEAGAVPSDASLVGRARVARKSSKQKRA